MTFHIGQKVVCIQDSPGPEIAHWCNIPVGTKSEKISVGSVYIVRDIDIRAIDLHGVATLRFEGMVLRTNMTIVGEWEGGFPASYFRPIIERKTDISIFTAMLKPTLADVTTRQRQD